MHECHSLEHIEHHGKLQGRRHLPRESAVLPEGLNDKNPWGAETNDLEHWDGVVPRIRRQFDAPKPLKRFELIVIIKC